MEVLPAGRVEADHLGPVALRLEDQLFRDDALAEDAAVVVNVVEEEVERLDALEQAGLHRLPFRGGDRPGDEVEGENLLDPAAVGIDGKGDALVDEDEVGGGAALLELGGLQAAEAFDDEPGVGVRPIRLGEEFIPGRGVAAVAGEQRRRLRRPSTASAGPPAGFAATWHTFLVGRGRSAGIVRIPDPAVAGLRRGIT